VNDAWHAGKRRNPDTERLGDSTGGSGICVMHRRKHHGAKVEANGVTDGIIRLVLLARITPAVIVPLTTNRVGALIETTSRTNGDHTCARRTRPERPANKPMHRKEAPVTIHARRRPSCLGCNMAPSVRRASANPGAPSCGSAVSRSCGRG
jgi:hypothetical protein